MQKSEGIQLQQGQIIIHVDMDAFYASVEQRDNPSLQGLPVIIGAKPEERGVVATCSYEARVFGIHSGMNIKEAYNLCPQGIYIHPDFRKYKSVSEQLHSIWNFYCSKSEYIALDEAYLDITDKVNNWEDARQIAKMIKMRTKEELNLNCSIGLGYSKTAAKMASEEKKPNGYFEILNLRQFVNLIINREVDVLYTIGKKTKQKLNQNGIYTVSDIRKNEKNVIRLLGKQGKFIVDLSYGIDNRKVTPYNPEDAKTIGQEITFQEDVNDYDFLKDALLLLSICVSKRAKETKLYGMGVSIKITYSNMKEITRRQKTGPIDEPIDIYNVSEKLLNKVEKKSNRLIGVGIYDLKQENGRQISMDDIFEETDHNREKLLNKKLSELSSKYNYNFLNNFNQLYQRDMVYEIIEYMRKSRN